MKYIVTTFLSLMVICKAEAALPAPQQSSRLDVVIYTIPGCMGCGMAKSMLEARKIPYKEIDLTGKPVLYQEMIRKTGGNRTVPQIFINGKHIGGYSDLSSSDLDALTSKNPQAYAE
jgi:glutaredoxin 3